MGMENRLCCCLRKMSLKSRPASTADWTDRTHAHQQHTCNKHNPLNSIQYTEALVLYLTVAKKKTKQNLV